MTRRSGNGVGAVYEQRVAGPGGRSIEADIEITRVDEPTLIEFRTIAGPVRPQGRYELSASGGSTMVRFTLTASLGGVRRLLAPIVQQTMRTETRAHDRLQSVLDANGGPPARVPASDSVPASGRPAALGRDAISATSRGRDRR